jgi:hypothetical protein
MPVLDSCVNWREENRRIPRKPLNARERINKQLYSHITHSKLKWAFPFCKKYDQIKYTTFSSKLNFRIKLLNFFLCLYYKEIRLTVHSWSYFSQNISNRGHHGEISARAFTTTPPMPPMLLIKKAHRMFKDLC